MKVQTKITMIIDGKEVAGKIDPEHFCMVDIYRAIRNNKDPIEALALLAELGSKALADKDFRETHKHEEEAYLGGAR